MSNLREWLESIPEAELRRSVLVPLLKRMGYRDVREYHGGPLERGKDIVMWREDDWSIRRNSAVVAKAGKITGSLGGKSGMSAVVTQIQQCLGSSFQDAGTATLHKVDFCLVIASGEISKNAREAITNALEPLGLNSRVTLIDGDKLASLVGELLPTESLAYYAQQMQAILKSDHTDVKLTAVVSDDKASINIEPKNPSEPVVIKPTFKFPDTMEGKAAQQALLDHINKGTPAKIPGQFIVGIEGSGSLKDLFEGEAFGEFTLGPKASTSKLMVWLEISSGDETVRMGPLVTAPEAVGEEQVTITSVLPKTIALRLVVDSKDKRGVFSLQRGTEQTNVREDMERWRFISAAGNGGLLRILDCGSGLPIFAFVVPKGAVPCPDEEWIAFLVGLSDIQDRTGVRLELPDRDITGEEVEAILEVARIVRDGILPVPSGTVTIGLSAEGAANTLDAMGGDERETVRLEGDETTVIFGKSVDLGRAITVFKPEPLDTGYIEQLRAEIAQAGDETVNIRLLIDEHSEARKEYPRFIRNSGLSPEGIRS